ncbi:hypothetical protein NC651_008880 [Populus alba x Populus x berolinensis]|nr:hypothetical protein NC651_008880 [Populus alba x Populus x berolinensis]
MPVMLPSYLHGHGPLTDNFALLKKAYMGPSGHPESQKLELTQLRVPPSSLRSLARVHSSIKQTNSSCVGIGLQYAD